MNNEKSEQIQIVTTFTIRYPDVPGGRDAAIKYAVDYLPHEGLGSSPFGVVCVKRGSSALAAPADPSHKELYQLCIAKRPDFTELSFDAQTRIRDEVIAELRL